MPWAPELFSAPFLQRVEEQWGRQLVTVPFFDGVLAGEVDALVGSFAGEPEVHDPVRGRIRGVRAFERYVSDIRAWLNGLGVSVENVEQVVAERHGFAEVVLHLDNEAGRVALPVAVVSDRRSDGRILELRMYFSSWPLTGRHVSRPPLLQPDPELRQPDVVADYQCALSAGDVTAVVAAFEPDGYTREAAGKEYVHTGSDGLRTFYELLLSNDGSIAVEQCTLIDDERSCALEGNIVRWGQTELPPQAGMTVFVRGQSGRLAAARLYNDVDPP
jgi:hypothetical protein